MDTHQYFGFDVTGRSLSFAYHPLLPAGPLEYFKDNLGNSPHSPYSTHVDSNILTTISDSLEEHSPRENISGGSVLCNDLLENYRYIDQVPTFDCSFFTNINPGQNIEYPLLSLQELETDLMGPETVNAVDKEVVYFKENRRLNTLGSNQISKPMSQAPFEELEVQSQPFFASSGYWKSDNEFHMKKHHKISEEQEPLQDTSSNGLKQLLIECARALWENKIDDFNDLVELARRVVSISGDPIQRLGAYMVEGLVARKEASGNNIYRTLRCSEPEGKDLLSYMHVFYDICPYLKFGYMAVNGAIAQACRDDNQIHIIDFQVGQGIQWVTLLQAFAARPGGPPQVRITGIYDPVSHYARGGELDAVGRRVAAMSEKFNIPVKFCSVPVCGPDITRGMLNILPGEALAVNFPLQLHHIPDESVDICNPRDELIRRVRSLSPKVVTLVEQESNTNTTPFFSRFQETLDFYSAMFESIDENMALPRGSKDRINVEQHCLARDIVNIIACEGKDRVERHEVFRKWKSRFTMAGFQQCSMSTYVGSVMQGLLGRYSEHYKVVENDGAIVLGWKNRNIISASAWH